MKLRIALTITAERARKDAAPDDQERPPAVDHKGSFVIERAEPQPIGFTVPTTRPWEGE